MTLKEMFIAKYPFITENGGRFPDAHSADIKRGLVVSNNILLNVVTQEYFPLNNRCSYCTLAYDWPDIVVWLDGSLLHIPNPNYGNKEKNIKYIERFKRMRKAVTAADGEKAVTDACHHFAFEPNLF